ncbi:intercellular adhesion molecule 1-like [Xyrichtys novacula]|uniref:Intercellular adhesion molecule 1-like n=1 Tax=Xyrichtys novacula TaxID=13765 RepID=A0AAV1GNN8_XYRNO|nr:intercellular adhesion molecule 1-like [Xyrichtys novacula]
MWYFMLIGLVAYSGQPVSSYCPIQMTPPTAVVEFGKPFSANCSSLSNQMEKMGWETTLGTTSNKDNYVSLQINSVTEWDFAPQCYINMHDGEQCSEDYPITVYKLPDQILISQSSSGPMRSGQTYRIQCDLVNVAPVRNLSVNWYLGDKLVSTETFDKSDPNPKSVSKSSFLDLKVQSNDNGALLQCEAELNFGSVVLPSTFKDRYELVVLYPPTFSDPANETLEIPIGDEMILNCTAAGNPSPKYSWQFPQQANNQQKGDQHVFSSSFQHPGTYTCTASNSEGSSKKFFTVTEAQGDRTTFGVLIGGGVLLGCLLGAAGLYFVKPDGSFALS